ncbi:aminoacyl-tRNA hydrolase [Candidatus Uhrbacteria bacterium]|nr:aminoacyl-tRNA hydrolase [Candidatus Uhrbacteria bacterium]
MNTSAYILIGLRNPGDEYESTRHNVGASALEYCMEQWNRDAHYEQSGRKKSRLYETREYRYWMRDDASIDIVVVLPNTYMNLSGNAIKSFLHTYFEGEDAIGSVWVYHDDIDLPFGSLKIDRNVSSGGHKGVQNIIDQLGTKDFVRFRIGIQPPHGKKGPADEFVLKKFAKTELATLHASIFSAIRDATELAFQQGVIRAQNMVNSRR